MWRLAVEAGTNTNVGTSAPPSSKVAALTEAGAETLCALRRAPVYAPHEKAARHMVTR
jgi:hypothetical protein